MLTFADALAAVGIDGRDGVYWAGRTTLVVRHEDIVIYDDAFAVFWEQLGAGDARREPDATQHVVVEMDSDDDNGDDDTSPSAPGEDPTMQLRFSAAEVLRHKDFAAYSDEELALAQELMQRLRLVGPPRRSVRLGPSRHVGRPDLRRTVRASLRSQGEPIRRYGRQPGTRVRRLVLLLDVSGSMEPYARALLRFVQAAVAGRQRVEAFALGTRLTRLTKELASRDPDKAMRLATDRVADWSGGTRLGTCVRRFNDDWGVRGMARGAIVVVLSDGWDRGEPDVLAAEMQRLQRVTSSLIWVNPLKVTPGYAPLARGMAAALPYVDHFVEGHSIAAMETLAQVISARDGAPRRPTDARSVRATTASTTASTSALASVIAGPGSGVGHA